MTVLSALVLYDHFHGGLSKPGAIHLMQFEILDTTRSGCCAGIDQVAFEVPAGIEGCNVPIRVRYGTTSAPESPKTDYGFKNLAVAATGDVCADPFGVPGPVKYGQINLGRRRHGKFALFGVGGADPLPPPGTCGGRGNPIQVLTQGQRCDSIPRGEPAISA